MRHEIKIWNNETESFGEATAVRAFVLAAFDMTEESLGTGVLTIWPTPTGWGLRYADSCGTFEGSAWRNDAGSFGMEWDDE